MTDPVILLGTQSNGETLPVQVDGFGRLVAEGLPGPEGPEGPSGGSFPLPADPYEGALLGWLNGELSWVGTPPVPIPPGVFGPITAWDAQSGLLTVEGEIPAAIGSGVYVWQCNEDGTYFTEGWNTSQVWSDGWTSDSTFVPTDPSGEAYKGGPLAPFDPSRNQAAAVESYAVAGKTTHITWNTDLTGNFEIKYFLDNDKPSFTYILDGVEQSITDPSSWNDPRTKTFSGRLTQIKIATTSSSTNNGGGLFYVKHNNKILVDNELSLNFRVMQVLGQSLLGIPSATVDFTIGKYLRVPEQRVAPWVLYGNDPTSLIDHLRSS